MGPFAWGGGGRFHRWTANETTIGTMAKDSTRNQTANNSTQLSQQLSSDCHLPATVQFILTHLAQLAHTSAADQPSFQRVLLTCHPQRLTRQCLAHASHHMHAHAEKDEALLSSCLESMLGTRRWLEPNVRRNVQITHVTCKICILLNM